MMITAAALAAAIVLPSGEHLVRIACAKAAARSSFLIRGNGNEITDNSVMGFAVWRIEGAGNRVQGQPIAAGCYRVAPPPPPPKPR